MTFTFKDKKNSLEDVAIVGMSCLFPGAPTLGNYWQNILDKKCVISDPPDDWQADLYFDAHSTANDRTYCKKGGYLGELAHFDPLEFGVMPSSLDGGEPDHYLALKIAKDALLDAGYTEKTVNPERTEVIVGRGTYINRGVTNSFQHTVVVEQTLGILHKVCPDLTEKDLQDIKEKLKKNLPPFNAETVQSLVPNILTGRIANRLNFMGPNYLVDAACASALIALEHGMRDLRSGKCDLALIGGVNASIPPTMLVIFSQIEALSHKQEIIPFDESADGTILGEGVGFVALKRKNDAKRDGDRIYAVIKSIGVSSDGRAIGLLAPRMEGQALAIKRAYQEACIKPESIELIEAHGTGTSIGDITEIASLKEVFGQGCGQRPNCALGTVKSLIGHLIPASGIASIIKTAFSLYHKVLPPTICRKPIPELQFDKTPFYINSETRPWIHGAGSYPRRAGVNAFGFGGINSHAILEEFPVSDESLTVNFHTTWSDEVFLFKGDSRPELIKEMEGVRYYLQKHPDIILKDLAYSLNVRECTSQCRLSIVAGSTVKLIQKIDSALKRLDDPSCSRIKVRSGIYFFSEPLGPRGGIAFLFPGEGSQYENMLLDLCIHFPEVRAIFDLVDHAFVDHERGYLPSHSVFPLPLGQGKGRKRFWAMDSASESVFASNMAILELMKCLQIKPDVLLGHSTGEYSAILASGILKVENQQQFTDFVLGVNSVYEQLAKSGQIAEGILLSVGAAKPDCIQELIEKSNSSLHLAMDNCPQQIILCGSQEEIINAENVLRKKGAILERLPFNRAYHTPLFQPICKSLLDYFKKLDIYPPAIKIYSCASARPYPDDVDSIRQLATSQWARRVCFTDSVHALYDDGIRIFLEVGPNGNLVSFVDNILQKKSYLAVASNLKRRSGTSQLNHLVGLLAAHHVPHNPAFLYKHRQPVRLPVLEPASETPTPGKLKKSVKINLTLPRMQLSKFSALQHGKRLDSSERDNSLPGAPHEKTESGSGPQFMQEYLNNMEQFLNCQNEVLSVYLEEKKNKKNFLEPKEPFLNKNLPFITKTLTLVPGQQVECLCQLTCQKNIFLLDHTLGSTVSAVDKTITALPIVPLTFSMEIMAEGASLLMPGKKLIGMREIRASRWIGLDSGNKSLMIRARIISLKDEEVKVEVFDGVNEQKKEKPAMPIIEGFMIFADQFPETPTVDLFSLKKERSSKWKKDDLYSGFMFHGSSLQGVSSMESCGDNGATAKLRAMPIQGLFSTDAIPQFLSDPVVLDAAGQVIAYWTSDYLEKAYHIFPFRLESLQLYGESLRVPEEALCRAKIDLVEDTLLRSDIDIVASSGRLRMRLRGWWDRRFDQTNEFYKLRVDPLHNMLSKSWPVNGERDDRNVVFRIIQPLPENFLTAHDRIWMRVLANLVLSSSERRYWYDLNGTDERKVEWLLGRTAAKDAIRCFLKENQGVDIFPADIEIDIDDKGKPFIVSINGNISLSGLSFSISHSEGIIVACAGKKRNGMNLGIDIEVDRQLAENFEQAAFSREEKNLVKGERATRKNEWFLRFWCAREAVAKALGTGLSGSGRLSISGFDKKNSLVDISISDQTGLFSDLQSRNIRVQTMKKTGLVVAIV